MAGTVANLRPWPKGVSGNPGGRPVGSRVRLTAAFIEALADDFDEHGQATVIRVREGDPTNYLRIVATLLPKEMIIERPLEGLSDDELAGALEFIRSKLAESDRNQAGSGVDPQGISQPVIDVCTIPETS